MCKINPFSFDIVRACVHCQGMEQKRLDRVNAYQRMAHAIESHASLLEGMDSKGVNSMMLRTAETFRTRALKLVRKP